MQVILPLLVFVAILQWLRMSLIQLEFRVGMVLEVIFLVFIECWGQISGSLCGSILKGWCIKAQGHTPKIHTYKVFKHINQEAA